MVNPTCELNAAGHRVLGVPCDVSLPVDGGYTAQ